MDLTKMLDVQKLLWDQKTNKQKINQNESGHPQKIRGNQHPGKIGGKNHFPTYPLVIQHNPWEFSILPR